MRLINETHRKFREALEELFYRFVSILFRDEERQEKIRRQHVFVLRNCYRGSSTFAFAFAVGVDGWRLARMILMGELATILMGKAASKNWMSNAQ